MKKEFIEEMKNLLIEEQIRLKAELSQNEFPEYGDDEDENASEVADYSNNLSLESELEKALRDVETSLKRIESGDYGVCKYCKSEISEARLKARSTSTSCIACKKTLTQEI